MVAGINMQDEMSTIQSFLNVMNEMLLRKRIFQEACW